MNLLKNTSEQDNSAQKGQDQAGKYAKLPPEAINLERFIEAARRGSFPGASGSAKIANRIANLLGVISDDAAAIDLELIEGACEMLRLQHGPWRTDADKRDVFRLLDRALGK